MAGDNSTTEPPMLDNTGRDILYIHTFSSACAFLSACAFFLRARFSLRAHLSRLFSDNNLRIFRAQVISWIGRESNPGLSRGRQKFYHNHRCLTIMLGTYSILIYVFLRALFSLRAILSLSLSSARAREPDFTLVCKLYAPYCLPLDIAY